MKSNKKKKSLTLGELIVSGYRACGKRRTNGIIRLAAKARLILLHGNAPFTIS